MDLQVREMIEKYISEVRATLAGLPVEGIDRVVRLMEQARHAGKRVFIFGNGGSAATATHFASDLCKGAICEGKPRMKAFALTDNAALLSAWANDTAYEHIFAEQLENFIEDGDIAIGISGSGNSPNVLNGMKMARAKGATTIGLIGFDGGKLKELVDIGIIVPNHNMKQVEDIHLLLAHIITDCLRKNPETHTSGAVHQAMILAAGEGTRLRPLTIEVPKALLPVNGKPAIEYALSWLKKHGISEVAINLYHQGRKMEHHLGDGSGFGIKVFYSHEETLRGTAGGVRRVGHLFHDTFVVLYGDVLTDFDLSDMIEFHRKKKAVATLAVVAMPDPHDVGVVDMDAEGRIKSFVEKPELGLANSGHVNGGVYVLEREILDYIPDDGFSDFACDIFPRLLELGLPLYGYILKPDDYLVDIGTMAKYRQAGEDIKTGKMKTKFS